MDLNSINYESVPPPTTNNNLLSEMTLYVYHVLEKYDESAQTSLINPYKDSLLFETINGSIKIPIEIQQVAIDLYKTNTQNNKNNKNNKNSYDVVDRLFQFLLLILIIFTLIYTLSLFRRGIIRF